ncbi:MAG: tetratricopeptide repeat protein [Candidatus Hodarchaeales archaeon]
MKEKTFFPVKTLKDLLGNNIPNQITRDALNYLDRVLTTHLDNLVDKMTDSAKQEDRRTILKRDLPQFVLKNKEDNNNNIRIPANLIRRKVRSSDFRVSKEVITIIQRYIQDLIVQISTDIQKNLNSRSTRVSQKHIENILSEIENLELPATWGDNTLISDEIRHKIQIIANFKQINETEALRLLVDLGFEKIEPKSCIICSAVHSICDMKTCSDCDEPVHCGYLEIEYRSAGDDGCWSQDTYRICYFCLLNLAIDEDYIKDFDKYREGLSKYLNDFIDDFDINFSDYNYSVAIDYSENVKPDSWEALDLYVHEFFEETLDDNGTTIVIQKLIETLSPLEKEFYEKCDSSNDTIALTFLRKISSASSTKQLLSLASIYHTIKPEVALIAYLKVLHTNDELSSLLIDSIISILRKLHEERKEEEIIDIIVHSDFACADLWWRKGQILLSRNEQDEALDAFKKAVTLEPTATRYWLFANELEEMDKHEEALLAYNKANELDPEFVDPWCDKGYVYLKLERVEEALLAFKKSAKIDPEAFDGWIGQVHSLFLLKRYREVIKLCDDLLTYITRSDPDTIYFKAESHFALGEMDEAARLFDRVHEIIEEDPEDFINDYDDGSYLLNLPTMYIDRGIALTSLNKIDNAIESFKKALAYKPDCDTCLYHLALLHVDKNEEQSIEYLEDLFKINPELKSKVKNEPIFIPLKERPQFIKLLND